MFFFSRGHGLVEHILVISHGIMVGNYMKRKKWYLMKIWAKLPKVKNKKKIKKNKKKERNNCSFMFLRFYVERAWNQKKLSIGD